MTASSAEPHRDDLTLARFLGRIEQKSRDRSAAPVLIVALGDSVTQGIGAVDQLYHEEVYHAQLKRKLQQSFPLCTFSVINAGVDGNAASDGLARLDRDVIRHQPDLVTIAFGLNDAVGGGVEGLDAFARNIETMIDRIRGEARGDVLLLTPNMMLTCENDAIPPVYRCYTGDFLAVQNTGVLHRYAQALVTLGRDRGVPIVDVYTHWAQLAHEGVNTTAMLSNGLNHPDPSGHTIVADLLAARIAACREDRLSRDRPPTSIDPSDEGPRRRSSSASS